MTRNILYRLARFNSDDLNMVTEKICQFLPSFESPIFVRRKGSIFGVWIDNDKLFADTVLFKNIGSLIQLFFRNYVRCWLWLIFLVDYLTWAPTLNVPSVATWLSRYLNLFLRSIVIRSNNPVVMLPHRTVLSSIVNGSIWILSVDFGGFSKPHKIIT